MLEVKDKEQQEILNKAGNILLEIKCFAKMGALASDSCIIDDNLQMQDNLEYYFILRKITDLIEQVESLLQD